MNSVVARPISRAQIRALAGKIRNCLGPDEVFFPIIHFLELAMTKVDPEFALEIVDDERLPNCLAQACPEQHLITVRESVYNGAVENNGRDRFTLCHELGHYLLHGSGNVMYLRSEGNNMIPTFRNPEWQANTFAGELLIPPNIARNLPVEEIMHICGTTYTVACIQKQQLHSRFHKKIKLPCG